MSFTPQEIGAIESANYSNAEIEAIRQRLANPPYKPLTSYRTLNRVRWQSFASLAVQLVIWINCASSFAVDEAGAPWHTFARLYVLGVLLLHVPMHFALVTIIERQVKRMGGTNW